MISSGYGVLGRNASRTLGGVHDVRPFAVEGDFDRLPGSGGTLVPEFRRFVISHPFLDRAFRQDDRLEGLRVLADGVLGDGRLGDRRQTTKRASHGSWASTLIERRLGCACVAGHGVRQDAKPSRQVASAPGRRIFPKVRARLPRSLSHPTPCSNSCSPPLSSPPSPPLMPGNLLRTPCSPSGGGGSLLRNSLQRERSLSCNIHPCQNAGQTLLSPHENDYR